MKESEDKNTISIQTFSRERNNEKKSNQGINKM
jgi:hypothetical protein